MAPPELPKTSLALGPAKAKKKKRLAFRPGQRAPKVAPKKKVAPEIPKKKPAASENPDAAAAADFAEESHFHEEVLETPETNLTNDDDEVVEEEDVHSALPEKEPKPPATLLPKKSASPKLGSALKNRKTSAAKIIGTSKSKPSSTRALDSPSKTTQKVSPAATKTNTGRKRKSTGLVIGASITKTKRNIRQVTQEEDEPSKRQQEAPAEAPQEQVAAAAAPTLAFPMPADMPAPLEGEVTLGKLCSSFKGVPLHEPDQPAQRNRQRNRDRDRDNNNQDNHNNPPPAPVMVAPEVQIINGEIVLQEESLVVEDRAGATMGRAGGAVIDEGEYDVVEEDAHADMTIVQAGYQDFKTRTKSKNWTADETKLFFEILRQVGTDFGLMAEFFEGRNRKQLKRKYRQELTRNPQLVDKALHPAQQKPLDLTVFEITKDQVEEQVEAAKKKEREEIAAREREAEEAKKKKAEEEANKENGMEVVEEDEEDEDLFAAMMQKPKEKSAYELEVEALKPMEPDDVPLWPDEEEGEDPVVEEDPMMMEDFDTFGEHDDGGEDYVDTSAKAVEEKAEADEPALSLLPSGNKKKKKPKFRSSLTGRKKK